MKQLTDEVRDAQFEAWWEKSGQFCRSGGGAYEKTFAYTAWLAALDTAQPEPLITVESSLRFRLESEKQKSDDLLDEVRELKGKLLQAQPERAPLSDEQDRALCEAYYDTASDEYFKVRPQLESDLNRRIFYAGHRYAWINYETAHGIKQGGQHD